MTEGHPLYAWREWLIASGKPRTTVKLCVYQLRRWEEHHPRLLSTTTGDLVSWLASHAWKPDTVKSFRAALVSFYGWAHLAGRMDHNPALTLPSVRCLPHPPRPAPESAVATALLAADPRVTLMLILAARHGMRRGEIARGHSDDLMPHLVGWSLRVHGKGAKDRVIPLGEGATQRLQALPEGWAFPSPYGGHLSEQHVGKLIARALPEGWTAHTLRHRFATVAYAGTRDLLAVQELLGHSRPETTRGYILMPQDALRSAVLAAA